MIKTNNLKQYGWNDFFEAYFAEYAAKGLHAARVAVEHRNYYELYSEFGELTAEKSGKLFYSTDDLPRCWCCHQQQKLS